MAKGRTVSARELTTEDRVLLETCDILAKEFRELIGDRESRVSYYENWGKVNLTRDAGAGRGGAKIQRDALCTRGRTDKAPFSNRNLRWHPLVVANVCPDFAKPIEKIEIISISGRPTFRFEVEIEGKSQHFLSSEVYTLPRPYAVLPKHWEPHFSKLKVWNDENWTDNSCLISANESCTQRDAIEIFVSLNASILVSNYKLDVSSVKQVTKKVLLKRNLMSIFEEKLVDLIEQESLYFCPICKNPLEYNLEDFRNNSRSLSWKPGWKENKQSEGEDHSPQVMHVNPLVETEIRHTAMNVRYGHRWCNITMTDHSLDETLRFMKYVVERHK